jgi:hydrogenase nickel incorporation protein HypA/HybF
MRAVHELALTESLVEAIEQRLPDARISRVRLRVGRLMAVAPEALVFCFDVCTQGTRLAGATLEIVEVAARGRCRGCGCEGELDTVTASCQACAGFDVELLAGRDLQIESVEVV